MDFVVVHTKINKNKIVIFFSYAWALIYTNKQLFYRDETKRNVIFQETKRNGTIFFLEHAETENRNEIIIFQKQNGTKRKKKNVF
jgi:hypothetical protein